MGGLGGQGMRSLEGVHPPFAMKLKRMGRPAPVMRAISAEESLFFFEDQVGRGGAGCDFDPVRYPSGDVDDVTGMEDDFFSALDAGAEGFAGAAGAVVGVLSLHGAVGDEGDRAFFDDYLVGEELMTLGLAGVDADDEEGVVVAIVFKPSYGHAGWARLGSFDQFDFALLEVGGGMGDGLGGLGEERGCDECEAEDDAAGHAGSLGDGQL